MTLHSAESCHHDVTVAILHDRSVKFEKAIEEIAGSLRLTNSLLGTLAEQGAEIKHLREDTLRNEKDIDAIFGRVRSLEMAPGRVAGKVSLVVLASIGGCIGSTITGVVVFFATKG